MQERLNEEIQERNGAGAAPPHSSRVMRALYLTVGFAALILAVVGIVLPVLPTTPFVLLAAACFARSSKHFHDKLLANRIAGPIIREWIEHHSIPHRVKRWVYLLMVLSFGGSILLMPSVLHQVMLGMLGIILVAFIWRIPVRDVDTNPESRA